ncbi:MAG: hypothetical protein M3Y77_10965 [Actinomycetota bacterium]|nr:hypothetical protein [Actinomycetota bacterium]MDQ2956451.1 hypothetical protein [Actinomycetota bacterium]
MPGTTNLGDPVVDAALTIQKSGLISLNRPAYVTFGRPSTVELLYDRAASVLGLRAVDPQARHGYPVRSATGRGNGPYVVSALAFTRFYDIDISRSRRWPITVRDGVLLADLSDAPSAVTGTQLASVLSNMHR